MVKRIRVVFAVAVVAMVVVAVSSSFNRRPPPAFVGEKGEPNWVWPYTIDASVRCWLRLVRHERAVIRVNCFAIDGVLHTHSNRFVPVASLLGRSWTQSVAAQPDIEVLIDGRIYTVRAKAIVRHVRRREILEARHYRYIPDAIQVYALLPRDHSDDGL